MSIRAKRVEEASLNAWPALQQILYDGWILRFSQGYTKRANSVNPISHSSIDLETKIMVCESYYKDKNLPSIFRLTSISSPAPLDKLLTVKKYHLKDPTDVLQLKLTDNDFQLSGQGAFVADEFENWLENHSHWNQIDPARKELHARLLKSIPGKAIFATFTHNGSPVACGLGVLEDRYVGIFDLVTAPDQRRRGYGTNLLRGLVVWAQANGADYAYLQVMQRNGPAQSLYRKEGFVDLYHYWYRVPKQDRK